MQLSNAPSKIVEAFAVNGSKNTIPVPTQIPITPGAASFNDGFPPLTMTPLTSGGVVMSGLDMNGILNMATAVDNWMSAGAGFKYDSVFSASIGGYPNGARILNAAGNGYWLSIVDNNVTDPDTGGAGWIPFGGSTAPSASVYASAQQTIATGNTKVLWDTVEFDTFGLWNAGANRFQSLWAGKYRLSGSVYLPSAAGQNMSVMIYKNGTLAKLGSQFPQVSDVPLTYSFDAIISAADGDYFETFMNVPSTAVLAGQVGSNQAYVYGQIEYLGA